MLLMRSIRFVSLVSIVILVIAGCTPPEEQPTVGDRLVVDPAAVSLRDPVGPFHLRSIQAREEDPEVWGPNHWWGEAHFEGEVELRGRYFDFQPDPPGPPQPCFEVDDDHAHQLPRFPGDERTAWFCFTNTEEAMADLGAPTEAGRLTTVIITDYHYIHHGSDVVNQATYATDVTRDRGHVLPDHPAGRAAEPPPLPDPQTP
jgi:hypothetical protein